MGFKSFARPTRLEFPQGMTALVGPNGSGKSNVVDAIRWSLGEQSARDLRGQRAEDVIYAGPRRVHGSAEVELTFESSAGEADWAELAIARRLFRSGESEYLLNRTRRRLRDVQSALHEVGLSNPRFAVVNQGMTDFLLSATPAERRALLEQAAGLAAYRQRRDEAAHKLAATEQNIATIEVVLAELEPRVRVLRRQARGVEERAENAERLRRALTAWYAWRWRENTRAMEALDRDVDAGARERRSAAEETMRLEEIAEQSLERERAWRAQLESAIAALHATERERDAARHEVNTGTHQLESANHGLQQGTVRTAHLVDAIREIEERRDAMLSAGAALDAELQKLSDESRVVSETAGALKTTVHDRQTAVAALTRIQQQAHNEVQSVQRDLTRLQIGLDRAEARRREVDTRVDEIAEEHDRLLGRLTQGRSLSERLQAEEAAARERHTLAEDAARSADRRKQQLARIMTKVTGRIAATSRELTRVKQSLIRVESAMGATVLGALSVRDGWDRAVAAALGEWALLGRDAVSSLSDAEVHSFLRWRAQVAQQLAAEVSWLDECVESGESLPSIMLGTIAAETEASASQVWRDIASLPAHLVGSPPIQVVARTGLCFTASGTRREPLDDRAALYLRSKRELVTLTSRLAHLEQRGPRLKALAEEAEGAAASTRQEATGLHKEVSGYRQRLTQHRLDLEQIERRLQRLEIERVARHDEQKTLASSVRDMQAAVDEAQARADVLARDQEAIAAQMRDASTELESAGRELSHAQERAAQASRSAETVRLRRDSHHELVRSLEREVARLKSELDQVQKELHQLQLRRQEACRRQEIAAKQLEDLETIHGEQVAGVEAARMRRPEQQDIRQPLRDARGRSAAAVSRHERLSARLGEVQAERMKLSEEIARELSVQVGELRGTEQDAVPTEDELRRLRSRAAQYAELDASVAHEYRELSERQRYLSAQVADLHAAAEGLHEVMRVADREMRTRFQSALDTVSEEFSRVFKVMLRGGEARLDQIDEDGGIEVRATLPGRRARSSSAFSGGERALVASSLLFAVLRIRPMPFCVLDEVDAALDETNVDRYLAALRDISERTQVIVVTHNRATMAAATVLYGLTMDGEGASTVLSLRLEAYDAAG